MPSDNMSAKEQELIRQLVQERLDRKHELEFESLADYVVPPKVFFSMIKKPAVSIRAASLEFSMSSIRLFEGVQYVLPMLNAGKHRIAIGICAEEELSSIEWARMKQDKWVNRTVTCPEYADRIYSIMNWNRECRYKAYGHLSNSERGLVIVFDLDSAVMFDPTPDVYVDKRTGETRKRIRKYYPDEIQMKLGRSYSDYIAIQQRTSFESLSGYSDTSGSDVPASATEEDAAAISMQAQARKREQLLESIIDQRSETDD